MPVLFSRCRQTVGIERVKRAPPRDSYLVPSTVWPYIRTINLSCCCVDGYVTAEDWAHYEPQESDVVCGPLASPDLLHALRNMPQLSTIVVKPCEFHVYGHGLAWSTLCHLFSLSQVSQLLLVGVHMCPKPPDVATLQLHATATLSCLEYFLYNIREQYALPSDAEALDRVLRSLHLSLETLSLPAEPTPMRTIPLLDWPRLRVLKLRGLRWSSPNLPVVTLFAGMTNLRVLVLELMDREGASGTALWPQGYPAIYPWPHLEELRVSHPDPDDELYAHLPRALHTLMLQTWPHQCIRRWQEVNYEPKDLRPCRPPASPSVLLRILQRCLSPHLRVLGVEYCADHGEASLLSCIAENFALLTTLELHRYLRNGDTDVPVLDIARSLAPLSVLRTLKVHLDFPEMPGPMLDRGDTRFWCLENPENFERRLRETATTFAQTLTQSLREVWYFQYNDFRLLWCIYGVVRFQVNGAARAEAVPLTNTVYETGWI
ncbi:hypothetical protein L227DRAFT_657668 [Lentinus tigrinus ALCF2SS1-6]|uniref:F-box domain-containing protein n=2 Tax=Lentinus tigrinus TaxID=5365 RepID=A0A5C2RSP9_9APHY|nr:hypothetical protein L227DRAFT_657668 [Lentinus tigrinus ALCF2SS1-6]